MEWSKAKSILLIVLAVVNVFLLGTYYFRSSTQSSAHDAAEAVVEYYASLGIKLDAGIVPNTKNDRTIMIIERSSELEAQAAKTLLRYGAISASVGGSVTYKADMGSISWRSGGVTEWEFAAPGGSEEADEVEKLRDVMEKAGIIPTWFAGNENELTMTREYSGCPVYNNSLSACLENGRWHISGKWYLGEPVKASSETEHEAAGLLVTFADELVSNGVEIKKVSAMEKGWIAGLVSNVGVKLTPVYRITTDIGDFYISAIDGSILTAE